MCHTHIFNENKLKTLVYAYESHKPLDWKQFIKLFQ
jgi:hypothetical protein